ncbi:MFS transporter [Amycolatopsis jejuensis]|uniref:MFS transporter n=1 Tax=Amycolatopsis jejuensis TaxID=330084 RepID=UPI00068B41C3|nr:MFS transporter [Amycolatopsis jejuensis]
MTAGHHTDDGRFTSRQRYIVITALLGLFIDGFDILIVSGALLGLVPAMGLSPGQVGLVSAGAFAGMVAGSLASGPLTDRFGRRIVFFGDMLLFIVSSALMFFAETPAQLIVLRVLAGVAIGADMPAALAMIAEFSPRARRGTVLALGNAFWPAGFVVAGALSIVVYQFADPAQAWRYLLMTPLVPAAVLVFLRREVPESPRWLLSRGRTEEAHRVFEECGFPAAVGETPPPTGSRPGLSSLLRRGRPRTLLLLVSAFWLVSNIVGSAILIYTPTVIKTVAKGGVFTPLVFATVVNVVVVVVNVATSLWVVDRAGRRPLAIVPSVVVAFALIAVAAASGNPIVIATGFAVVSIATSGMLAGVYYAWGSELFATGIRGRSLAITNAIGKLGSVAGVALFPTLFIAAPAISFAVLAVVVFAVVAALIRWAPETKGRSLDELEYLGAGEIPVEPAGDPFQPVDPGPRRAAGRE